MFTSCVKIANCPFVTKLALSNSQGCKLLSQNMRHIRKMSTESAFFRPKRAAVLTKMTRYEFEKQTHKHLSEEELRCYLESKRSDYDGLLVRHENHKRCMTVIENTLRKHNIEAMVVDRFNFDADLIEWADVIFTAGGDGTYLLAASKVENAEKPVIGINTDPSRSEGHLCLPKQNYSAEKFDNAIRRILAGKFSWKKQQRIRITMSGHHENDEPIELHDQQLHYPEHRFTEHVLEHETCRSPTLNLNENAKLPRILPVLALNEVFIGESLSSRVSYYETRIDDSPWHKQKSSGLTVCTGTGSSSWFFHIHQISEQAVKQILRLAGCAIGKDFPVSDENLIRNITSQFNSSFKFDASEIKMAYTTRDPINNGVFTVPKPYGYAQKIDVRSRMYDACLVVDGGSSFRFNDGAVATLEILDEDSLRTLVFH